MNIILFRKNIKKVENYQEKLKYFRTSIENKVAEMEVQKKLKIEEITNVDPLDYQNIMETEEEYYNKWESIFGSQLVELYSEMNWNFKNVCEDKTIHYSHEYGCTYINYYFSEAWDMIKKCNDIDFYYAILILAESIKNNKDSVLNNYITNEVNNASKKFELLHIQEIVDRKPKAFIAMWFNKNMYEARESIKKAINSNNYEAIIIDEKDHNKEIVPEIFFDIKNSAFVVADLTGQSNGVYYEAGYAEALGKTVIYTCKSSHYKKSHFDIAQKNIIKWKDENELLEKLQKRIKATIKS